jgi:hypothetical protein
MTPPGVLRVDTTPYLQYISGGASATVQFQPCSPTGNTCPKGFVVARHLATGRDGVLVDGDCSSTETGLTMPHFDIATTYSLHSFSSADLDIREVHWQGNIPERPSTIRTVSLTRQQTLFDEFPYSWPRGSWKHFSPVPAASRAFNGAFYWYDPEHVSGERLLGKDERCKVFSTRFLNLPGTPGTRLLVNAGSAAFDAEVFDENGVFVKSFRNLVYRRVGDSVDLTRVIGSSPRFGSIRITMFYGPGHLIVEHRSSDWSIGLVANCLRRE